MARLRLVVPVALLVTLALLFKAFDSMALALLTLLNVPFALVGGAIGLWLVDMPVSIAAAVGFHCARRSGVAKRRAGGFVDRRKAQARRTARRSHHPRQSQSTTRRADDGSAGGTGSDSGGAVPRHRCRNPASHRRRHRRRNPARQRCSP